MFRFVSCFIFHISRYMGMVNRSWIMSWKQLGWSYIIFQQKHNLLAFLYLWVYASTEEQVSYIDKTWLKELYFSIQNTISKLMKFTSEVMPMKLCIKKVDRIKYLGVTIDSKIPRSQTVHSKTNQFQGFLAIYLAS